MSDKAVAAFNLVGRGWNENLPDLPTPECARPMPRKGLDTYLPAG